MKCVNCRKPATHYVSAVFAGDGETIHADDYFCDDHAEEIESDAHKEKDLLEFEARELPK